MLDCVKPFMTSLLLQRIEQGNLFAHPGRQALLVATRPLGGLGMPAWHSCKAPLSGSAGEAGDFPTGKAKWPPRMPALPSAVARKRVPGRPAVLGVADVKRARPCL